MTFLASVKKTGKAVEKAFIPSMVSNDEDMDILDTLRQEHNDVKDLLAKLVESDSAPQRKSLLKQIKAALVPHTRAEEKIVYDAIIAQKDKGEKIDGEEGYIEHNLADKMLGDLGKITNATSPEFSAAAKVLKELVEHHIEEEENHVWKDIRKHYDTDERVAMNQKFLSLKKKVRA